MGLGKKAKCRTVEQRTDDCHWFLQTKTLRKHSFNYSPGYVGQINCVIVLQYSWEVLVISISVNYQHKPGDMISHVLRLIWAIYHNHGCSKSYIRHILQRVHKDWEIIQFLNRVHFSIYYILNMLSTFKGYLRF